MSIKLNPVKSGYSTGLISDNFDLIEKELNNNTLRRDGLSYKEANQMEVGLDMNSNFVYNLPEPVLEHQAARLQDVQNAIAGADQANLITFTPYKTLSSTNVQAAIQELLDESGNKLFETVSDMDADSTLVVGDKCRTLGYNTLGDGGGNDYEIVASATGTDDGGSFINLSGSGHQAKGLFVNGITRPNQFGAAPDNSTLNSSFFQAAVNYLANAGGGELSLSKGIYRVSTPIEVKSGVHIVGQGERATFIRSTTATDNIFNVGDGTNNPNDVSISHMTFDSTVTKTAGYYIKVINGHNIKISRIRMESPYHGIWFDGGNEQFLYYLDNFEMSSPISRGIVVGSDSLLPQDVWIRDGIIFGQQTGEGIFLRSGSGLYFSDIDVINMNKGIVTFPLTGNRVGACFFTSVLADSCVDNGWDLIEDGGITVDVTLQGCWGATCLNGLSINQSAGSVNGIIVDGGRFINNENNGMFLQGGDNVSFSDTQCFANSTSVSGLKHGLEVSPGVSNWTVKGGVFGSGGLFGNTNNQGWGILINSGASDKYSIIGVDVTGNVTGGISDGGTGTEKYIYGNVGFRTSSSGAGVISSGASSGTFSHNLGVTPDRADVQITATTSPASSGISSWYVSAVDATNVTVTANTTTTDNWFFGFSVRVKGA